MSEKQNGGYMTLNYVIRRSSSSFSSAGSLIGKYMKRSNTAAAKKEEEGMRSYSVNEDLGIRKMILDKLGNIQDFPGIEAVDFWVKELRSSLSLLNSQVMKAEFCRIDGALLMIWHFQDDYRANDTPYSVPRDTFMGIKLYSTLDDSGNFLHPFRIYSMQTESGKEIVYRQSPSLQSRGFDIIRIKPPISTRAGMGGFRLLSS